MEGMIDVRELRKVLTDLKNTVNSKPDSFERGWLAVIYCLEETFTELKEDDEDVQ